MTRSIDGSISARRGSVGLHYNPLNSNLSFENRASKPTDLFLRDFEPTPRHTPVHQGIIAQLASAGATGNGTPRQVQTLNG